MNRGDHREVIFCDEDDRGLFLATLGEVCQGLADIEEQRGQWHYGAELGESGEAKAERLIAQALQTDGVTEQPIANWRKGHPFKVRLAARLRAETTVTVNWIAHRLAMGTRGHLAHLLYRNQRTRTGLPLPSQPSLNI